MYMYYHCIHYTYHITTILYMYIICYVLYCIIYVCVYVGMVDVIFADVAQPDQARIVAINAHNFLKNEGHFVISIKVSVYIYVL